MEKEEQLDKPDINQRPKSNVAQIILAICAVITIFITVYYSSTQLTQIENDKVAEEQENKDENDKDITKTTTEITKIKCNPEDGYLVDSLNQVLLVKNRIDKIWLDLTAFAINAKPIIKTGFFGDSTGLEIKTDIGKFEMWQADESIGIITVIGGKLNEMFISRKSDSDFYIWFRDVINYEKEHWPVERLKIAVLNESFCITNRLYLKEGQGTELGRKKALSRMDRFFTLWEEYLNHK